MKPIMGAKEASSLSQRRRRRRRAVHLIMLPTTLFILLTLTNRIQPTHQYLFHNSAALDEEIIIEPQHDYERTYADHQHNHNHHQHASSPATASPANHDTRATYSNNEQQKKQSHPPMAAAQIYTHNDDPFAVTFEDYLKEASKISAHQIADDGATDTRSSSLGAAIPTSTTASSSTTSSSSTPLSAITKKPILIDYIFPSKQEKGSNRVDAPTIKLAADSKNDEAGNSSSELLDEIKLLFAWKQLPTNKCSKTCGKGFRINHLSCVDLKYKVRVEDSLCTKANLQKPKEIGDEACNEFDCPPEWIAIEFQQCSNNTSPDGVCHTNLFKRAQCQMVNKEGVTVHLEDYKCNSSIEPTSTTKPPAPADPVVEETKVESREEQDTRGGHGFEVDNAEINVDYSSDNLEKNDILSNIGSMDNLLMQDVERQSSGTKSHPHNEPFYEVGDWSECSGASCGQLGLRTRNITCRLYLSRSSKFAELPASSCQLVLVPDRQEPCYMDCPPETIKNDTMPELKINENDNNDETVYEFDLTRFVWRKDSWTKCSADCLGGRRESMIECWDKETESLVDASLCDVESKPQPTIESCNEIPCPPEWRAETFSKCTRTCGSSGIRTRSIICLQQVPLSSGPSHLIVSNDLCLQVNGTMPHKLEPCNRVDCRPEWNVGPWSECSRKCGEGIKNRTVICVQEFAHRDGPLNLHHLSPDLREAIAISSKDWYPSKATQVPFQECYSEYRTIPPIDEKCFTECEKEPYIDADHHQNYQTTKDPMKRKTLTLKVGGQARVMEGRNLKIRCKLMGRNFLTSKRPLEPIEWRKDGIKIFINGSTMADKQLIEDDNLILGNDVLTAEERNQFMADDPNSKKVTKQPTTSNQHHHQSKPRNLMVRSWNHDISYLVGYKNFTFVPQLGGRFSLVKENNLRIKRMRSDDSGTYTCSYGSLSESLKLEVISRQDLLSIEEKLVNNNVGQ